MKDSLSPFKIFRLNAKDVEWLRSLKSAEDIRLYVVNSDIVTNLTEPPYRMACALISKIFDVQLCFFSKIEATSQYAHDCTDTCASVESECNIKQIVVVKNAKHDDKYRLHDLVVGWPCVRFYAEYPIVLSDFHIGTLVLLDQERRIAFGLTEQILFVRLATIIKHVYLSHQKYLVRSNNGASVAWQLMAREEFPLCQQNAEVADVGKAGQCGLPLECNNDDALMKNKVVPLTDTGLTKKPHQFSKTGVGVDELTANINTAASSKLDHVDAQDVTPCNLLKLVHEIQCMVSTAGGKHRNIEWFFDAAALSDGSCYTHSHTIAFVMLCVSEYLILYWASAIIEIALEERDNCEAAPETSSLPMKLPDLFCNNCKSKEPPKTVSHPQMLELPPINGASRHLTRSGSCKAQEFSTMASTSNPASPRQLSGGDFEHPSSPTNTQASLTPRQLPGGDFEHPSSPTNTQASLTPRQLPGGDSDPLSSNISTNGSDGYCSAPGLLPDASRTTEEVTVECNIAIRVTSHLRDTKSNLAPLARIVPDIRAIQSSLQSVGGSIWLTGDIGIKEKFQLETIETGGFLILVPCRVVYPAGSLVSSVASPHPGQLYHFRGHGAECVSDSLCNASGPAAIVRRHSEVNPGSQADGEVGPLRRIKSNLAAPVHSVRVLVIEDSALVQKLFIKVLKQLNCSVTIAKNGKIGLQLLKTEDFDITFIDFVMPVQDGLATMKLYRDWQDECREIAVNEKLALGLDKRQLIRNEQMLLVGTSGIASTEEYHRAQQLDMHFFCRKPVAAELMSTIVEAVRKTTCNHDEYYKSPLTGSVTKVTDMDRKYPNNRLYEAIQVLQASTKHAVKKHEWDFFRLGRSHH